MKTSIKTNRSIALAGAAAALAVAAMGFAGAAQARSNVFWSVGVGAPGAMLNVGNVGSVYQPSAVYVQPQPVYVQPQSVYVQPAPVYYPTRQVYVRPAPIYMAPQQIYYGGPPYGHGYGYRHHDGRYVEAPRPVYGAGYAPAYYRRDGYRY